MLRALSVFLLLCLSIACAEPPNKEMNQAQGAIDAAKAAGAAEYAGDELTAAVEALAHANEAVVAKDYRLALAHALDSRERAQSAAKMAVDGRAKARGDAERTLAETTALVDRAEASLKASESSRTPRRATSAAETAVSAARQTLQEARAALQREEYSKVLAMSASVSKEIAAAIAALGPATPPPAKGRSR
jgi:hypothetical protein